MQWAQRQRLRFIEQQLLWEGRVNRGNIAETFSVSIVQASKDMKAYRDLLPNNTVYDLSGKTYLPAPGFTPGILQPSPEQLLREQALTGTRAEIMQLPGRNIDPDILRSVLRAVADETPIRITYQSLTRPQPFARVIRPHTFISDGFRWHVRGFCGEAGSFRDFLLARILNASPVENDPDLQGAIEDNFWNNEIQIKMGPHPGLTEDQQAVIGRDYGMTDGQVALNLRQAYLPYFLRHMNLVEETDWAKEQQLTIINRVDVDRWHREVMPVKKDGSPLKNQKPEIARKDTSSSDES